MSLTAPINLQGTAIHGCLTPKMFAAFEQTTPFVVPATIIICLIIVGLGMHHGAAPKPIPGIPYRASSASRLLGDLPGAFKHVAEASELYSYLAKTATDLNEPIFQMFLRPFSKPLVIVADFRESYDILNRRSKEFDRADIHVDVFGPVMPDSHVYFQTNSLWSAHRRLIDGAMAGPFIADVGTSVVYSSVQQLVALWQEKLRLAPGQSFDAKLDAQRFSLDLIWTFIFGETLGEINNQTAELSKQRNLPNNAQGAVGVIAFPETTDSKTFTSLRCLTDSMEIPAKSPFPRPVYHLLLRAWPSLVDARWHKDKVLGELIEQASARLLSHDKTYTARSVIDHMLSKELAIAQDLGRPPIFDTKVIRDELFALLFGGLGTSTVTVEWIFKYLADDQHTQRRLRAELKDRFRGAKDRGENPTASQIVEAHLPVMEAFLAEVRRHSCSIPAHLRKATVDTSILGHFIPNGTDVVMLNNGPSILTPSIAVDESKRGKVDSESEDKTGVWNDHDIRFFQPERWLRQNDKGDLEFDPWAGPSLPFGGGLRQCYGRKLVYVKQRMLVTLIVWNFEVLPLPVELVSWRAVDALTHRPQQVHVRLAAAQ